MAAAMQDYKRAIIIGSKQTYGKGTVQNVINLNINIFNLIKLLKYALIKPCSWQLNIRRLRRCDSFFLHGLTPETKHYLVHDIERVHP